MLAALAEGMVLVPSGDPPGKFLSSGGPAPSPLGCRGAGGLFWSTFPVVPPLAHAVPSVESRVLCARWGFDNSLLFFFFFFGNCRIIKYFNFKVSNFLLHT